MGISWVIDSPDVYPETFAPMSGSWAFLIQITFRAEDAAPLLASVVACSRSWMANAGWREERTYWSYSHTDEFLFPWGLLVLDDAYSYESLRNAVEWIVGTCDTGTWDEFHDNAARFVQWEDDTWLNRLERSQAPPDDHGSELAT